MITATNANLATYVCSGLALAIILSRFFVVRFYHVKLDLADWLSVFGLLLIVARLINDHYLLVDGTATDAILRHLTDLSKPKLEKIKIGSILALVARVFDTTFFWLQTAVLLLFYSNLLRSLRWVSVAIKVCWCLLGATYVAVIVVTFAECNPFHLYWQIFPNPGQCTYAYIQLSLQAGCNIALDLTILTLSLPLLRLQGKSTSQKIRITSMVCLGLFCIIITCIRLAWVVQNHSAQASRTFFASIQLLTSTFVANMPTIYGRLQKGRRRRAEQLLRRESGPELWWTSRSSTTKSVSSRGLRRSPASQTLEKVTSNDGVPLPQTLEMKTSNDGRAPYPNLEEKSSNDSTAQHHGNCINDIEIV